MVALRSLLLALVALTAVMAQSERGRISGRVQDQSGADAPNICVSLSAAGSTKVTSTVLTNDTGRYVFAGVPPGTVDLSFRYRLMLEGLGFQPRTLTIRRDRGDVMVPLVVLAIAPTIDEDPDSRVAYEAGRHTHGAVELHENCSLDLDTGKPTCPESASPSSPRENRADDLLLKADGRELYLMPVHGAALELRSAMPVPDHTCLTAEDVKGQVRVDVRLEGTRVCMRTNEGRRAAVVIWPRRTVCVEGDVTFGFVTWKR